MDKPIEWINHACYVQEARPLDVRGSKLDPPLAKTNHNLRISKARGYGVPPFMAPKLILINLLNPNNVPFFFGDGSFEEMIPYP